MKTLIVYDSLYGNTARITREIAAGLDAALGPEAGLSWQLVSQVEAEQLRAVDLLILGSPTQRFKPTPAMQQLLARLSAHSLSGIRAATFDTRLAAEAVKPRVLSWIVRLGGYAADALADRLSQLGAELLLPPEGFLVGGSEGPLQAGEAERARAWGASLAAQLPKAYVLERSLP